ncbi:divisome protein SepX/GlpR [Nocardioides deserti]|uniref:Uncharacterized protein n=1 Tax=Nocardioides deserti TaxID=1588644 RepID=A0ABR6UA69_9ACTN|nr:hypothetical protein [Nocardioides deserti]MBC2961336.1 hypothetical protein [Nocardioides deserti]GGO72450.1 hypothetical protein GCM10012276_15840 [Nocardioides deserti]
MDLSALIFVALAVAWAVYLIPKALKHHDDVQRSRSVDRFSDTMRVLARREPVDSRGGRLVVTPGRPADAAVVVTKPSVRVPAGSPTVRRAAAAQAARRRRRVLGGVLVLNAGVVGLAATSVVSWWWVTAPVALLVAWLVACRLMVRQERSARRPSARVPVIQDPVEEAPVEEPAAEAPAEPVAEERVDDTQGFEAVRVEDQPQVQQADVDPSLWEPVPVTLPTYVTKPAAPRRTVRTIDLDATGVWTSGRTDADAALAREADQAARAAKKSSAASSADDARAVGS